MGDLSGVPTPWKKDRPKPIGSSQSPYVHPRMLKDHPPWSKVNVLHERFSWLDLLL